MTAARVTLRRMGAADVEDFLAATAPAYAAERAVADHVGEAEAAARARTQTDRLLSQRGDTPGHHFAAVVDTATGDRVGGVWFFLDAETREGFVYYLKGLNGFETIKAFSPQNAVNEMLEGLKNIQNENS